jgi:hypothetical protein
MKSFKIHRKMLLALLAVLALTLNVSVVFAQSSSPDLGSIISSTFSNTSSLMVFVIELALGLGLGYFSAKIVKYMLALIGIFIIGVVLNVWATPTLEANIQQQFSSLGSDWSKIYPVLLSIIYILGLTTVLPIALGFIIGIVIAIAK